MENQKMKNVARYIEIGAKIFKGFALAGAIVCGVFALLVLILGKEMIANYNLNLGELTIYFNDSFPINEKAAIAQITIELLITGLLLVGAFFAMRILKEIVTPIKDGRPFEESITKNLRKLAWVSLAIGGLGEIIRVVGAIFTYSTIDLESLFASSYIESMEYTIEFDFTFVAVFCVIMFLSFIFQYGQRLQKESDETL